MIPVKRRRSGGRLRNLEALAPGRHRRNKTSTTQAQGYHNERDTSGATSNRPPGGGLLAPIMNLFAPQTLEDL